MMNQSFIFPRVGDCVQTKGIKQGSSHETIDYDISGTMQYVKQTYHNGCYENTVAPELAIDRDGFTTKYVHRMVLVWYVDNALYRDAFGGMMQECVILDVKKTHNGKQDKSDANQIDRFGAEFFHIRGLN